MVLENLVANVLNRTLGMYLQNFNAQQLNVGLFSGNVKLQNLELRREALDQLHLPLNVVEGHLGQLILSIPYSNLRGQPVKVHIEDVFLLAAPREDADYDAAEEEQRAHKVKMDKLESAELLKERNTEGQSLEEQKKGQSFTQSLVTAIVDNVQVTVKNIHIRYEDSISDPGHPFAAGITLAGFEAVSTDANWMPTFIQSTSELTHKLASLQSLAVYWDTDAKLIGNGKGSQKGVDHDEFVKLLKSMIVSGEETATKHQFILKPVSGRAGLEMNKSGKANRPKMKANLMFDELGFVLDDDQYRDALMLVDLFHYFIRHQEYKKLEPKSRPSEDPRAWLQFAGKAVLDRIHDKNKRWSWAFFKERRDDRNEYIKLFKKKKQDEKLTTEEAETLEKLERKLVYEDLRFWRSLARNQLRKENVGVQKAQPKQTWSSWIWGGAKAAPEHTDAADDSAMNEEQRKELYEAINFDEKQQLAEAIDMPREYVKMQVQLSLRTGSFTLKQDPHGAKTEILRLLFDTFNTEFLQRTDSMFVDLSLEGMRLYDGTTEGSLFPQIIKIKDAADIGSSDRIEELKDDAEDVKQEGDGEDRFKTERPENPFFALTFEKNPLDRSADTALTVKLKAMEIVYNPTFLVAVAKFFKPPETHMESIGALMETAGATVEQVRQQTRAGLEFALDEHKTINAQLDLQAPLIIIPDSVTRQSEICLIVDAGHVSVSSELVDQDTLKDLQSKSRQQLSESDYQRLEGLMYDKFKLQLDSTQVLIGTTIEDTKAQLDKDSKERNFHVIERIGMDFLVEICIVPKNAELTKFRITGNLPVLHASISDQKYKSLMKVIDFAIPKFSDPQVPTEEQEEHDQPLVAVKSNDKADLMTGRRPSAFQFSNMEHELVMEEEGSVVSTGEEFSDALEGRRETAASLNQRTFDFRFTVEKLQGSLFRSDPEGKKPDQLLVELIAETFYLNFYQQAFRMTAEVKLRTLAVEDHVEENPLPEFKYLITSGENFSTEKQDLFSLQFVKVNPEHPEFVSDYEGISTNLDVSVSTINLFVTRKTLLTLLDFVLITFTNPNQENNVVQETVNAAASSDGTNQRAVAPSQPNADKIRIRTDLKGIAAILNNDGIRLATLSLTTAKVAIFISGKTMRVGAHLGNLSLIDDVNQGVPETSSLRQLITIQGDELAHFAYETFDEDSEVYPGYDTSIELKAGSLKINFLTEPFRKIMDFGVKFGKMQAIFNAARQAAANQATQIQQRANKLHFDVLVKTPIVVFPRIVITDQPERDALTANLGEIYANNKFLPLEDAEDAEVVNNINAGVRNIRLTSLLHYGDDQREELEMIDKVDIDFKVTHAAHKPGLKRPDTEVEGSMSDLNLKITQEQLQFALELSRSIPAAFATTPDDEIADQIEEELPDETVEPAKQVRDLESFSDDEATQVSTGLKPELSNDDGIWTTLDLVFKIGIVGLELVNSPGDEPVGNISQASLSQFSLDNTSIKLRMVNNGSLESELLIRALTIKDSRSQGTNKFRKTMSLINNDVKQQFMASISMTGGKERDLVVLLTLDSPRVILALDYLFAIKAWIGKGLEVPDATPLEVETEAEQTDDNKSVSSLPSQIESQLESVTAVDETEQPTEGSGMTMAFRVNVVDAQVVLIANPALTSSEAIVLGTKQVLVAKQHTMTLQVEKVGMFLCRMDQFDKNRMRILDDFSITTSLDMRAQSKDSSMTNIEIDIEPLVLRLSLRDILLAMQIINRASAMSSETEVKRPEPGPRRISYGRTPSSMQVKTRAKSSVGAAASTVNQGPGAETISTAAGQQMTLADRTKAGSTVMSREELKVALQGIRVILIGDKHELPMLDWSVKKFDIQVRDWSANLTADTSIDTYFNIFNFSKSAWEPLIEPWTLGFHMVKEQTPAKLAVELYTRKSMELTLTSASIALMSKSVDFLSTDEDMLSKPRGMEAPYRIKNYTGFEMYVWAVGGDEDDENSAAKLDDGQEAPWRFEDAITMRESLSPEGAAGLVGVRLEGSGFNSIDKIAVTREGEILYNLYPRKDKVQHRLLVDVKLGEDNIKNITFRSPFLIENNTRIPIEIGVLDPQQGNILKIEKIAPGDARPAPVGAAFIHSIIVRPDPGFGLTWCSERLFWKDLLKRPTRTLTCRGESDNNVPPFYFRMHAAYNKKDPLTATYPYMRVRLHAPVEVQNLLPYDFTYRVFDHNTNKTYPSFLRKGGVSPMHAVELSHLLMLNVDMDDTPFKKSEFTVINSGERESFNREKDIVVKDDKDLSLRLKLHYYNVPDSGGAFRVSVYAQYLILNRTGLPLDVKSKAFLGATKAAAGQTDLNNRNDAQKPLPLMFSFPTDDKKNRALLKLGDSQWSKPQSFDAIGSSYAVTLPSASGRTEMMAGVHVSEGEGKYNLTRVVTIAPRFVLKNKMGEEVIIREPGSSEVLTLKEGDLLPLRDLRQGEGQQLCICYPGINNQWTSPFNITDVGCMHVKIAKAKQRQQLVRIDILMEGATLFLHLSIETKHWPFSMRNESNTEFLFWQANPNVNDDEEDRGSGWKPIRYRLPPRSVMPYAWDYPAAKRKEIILSANKREKAVKLAEIGSALPMRIPASPEQPRGATIDLNVKAEGPTQTLVLSNYKQSKSLYKQASQGRANPNESTSGFEVKNVDTDVTFSAQLRFAGIGLSLVNIQLRELVYLTLRDIDFKYSDSPTYQTVKATIKWIQIDNQLYGGIFPILFYPSVVPKTGKEMDAHPILHAAITRVKDDSYGVLYIKYFTILLQQMTLELDEDFIFALLDFIKIPGASWTQEQDDNLCDEDLDIPEPQQEQSGQDIYFEILHLQPMQFDISFVRTERINAEDTMTSSNPLMFAVNIFTMSVGNVNDAPIRYKALMLENARVSTSALVNRIKTHYVQESLRQIHVIIGSADFLGNPVGLFNNVASGIGDIFYEPYQGLVMNERPQDLGIGIAKGASSFVKKSVFGFSDSMAKFTGSMSKGLAAATMDKEFQDQRRISRNRNRPKHALYGITSGGNAFASSLASGIGGLARHPIEGAEKEGVPGFLKGVGKGFLGLATKPAIGAFDFASSMAEGVRNTTTVFDQEGLDRVRLARFIGQDGIVRPYSQREALGQFWLKTLDNGKYFNEEYIAHLELPGKDLMTILTYTGICLARVKKLQTEWDVPLKDIQTISKERTGIAIVLKGGTNGPFVPVSDEQARNWLYKQIAVAVNAFNDKYSARG